MRRPSPLHHDSLCDPPSTSATHECHSFICLESLRAAPHSDILSPIAQGLPPTSLCSTAWDTLRSVCRLTENSLNTFMLQSQVWALLAAVPDSSLPLPPLVCDSPALADLGPLLSFRSTKGSVRIQDQRKPFS